MEQTAVATGPVSTEPTRERTARQLCAELDLTYDFLIRTDSRREKIPVVHHYGFPVEYDPEESREVTMQPICHQKRWWPIPGAEPHGLADGAILTVTDTRGFIRPIEIAKLEMSLPDMQTIIFQMQLMRQR